MNIELLNTLFHLMIVKKKKASHFNEEVVKQVSILTESDSRKLGKNT